MSVVICPDGGLNGGSPDEIYDLTKEVCEALDLAIRRASAVFPHGRDYQDSPPGTRDLHAAEADRRLVMLREVYAAYRADLRAVVDLVDHSGEV